MFPYFTNLHRRIISDELTNIVAELAISRLSEFIEYRGMKSGLPDGNNSLVNDELVSLPGIKHLISSINLPSKVMIMMHKPTSKVKRHTDDPLKRNTVLITPISPQDNFAPTFFYNSYHDTQPAATCDFPDLNTVIFNTQQWHDLENNTDFYRINLQVCVEESFETVVDLYNNNKLFNLH